MANDETISLNKIIKSSSQIWCLSSSPALLHWGQSGLHRGFKRRKTRRSDRWREAMGKVIVGGWRDEGDGTKKNLTWTYGQISQKTASQGKILKMGGNHRVTETDGPWPGSRTAISLCLLHPASPSINLLLSREHLHCHFSFYWRKSMTLSAFTWECSDLRCHVYLTLMSRNFLSVVLPLQGPASHCIENLNWLILMEVLYIII